MNFRAGLGSKPGVVGSNGEALALQKGSQGLGSVLERGVNDGRLDRGRAEPVEQMLAAVLIGDRGDHKVKVGPIEGELVMVLRLDAEMPANIPGDFWGGGCCEAEDAWDFEFGGKAGQLKVVGPEVVSPFRDAMRFVDCEEGERSSGQASPEFFVGQALGSHVEEFQSVVFKSAIKVACFVGRQGGVQSCHRNPFGGERIDLVLHQCDERGDHQGESLEEHGGELVAERFTSSGREDRESGPVCQDGTDGRFLTSAKRIVTEVFLESLMRGGHGGSDGVLISQ